MGVVEYFVPHGCGIVTSTSLSTQVQLIGLGNDPTPSFSAVNIFCAYCAEGLHFSALIY